MSHNQTYSYNHPGYRTYEPSPTTYNIPTGDVSPQVYQGYTTNTNSASSYSTIQSPESIETQVPPIESAETEPSHSIEELDIS